MTIAKDHVMSTAKRLVTAATALLLLVSTLCAQERNSASSARSTIPVTAAASADRVRFTAPSTVVQIRLEVYGANGEKFFDNEIRGGNVIDWHLQNGQAETLPDGAYLCVVTVKSLSGRLTQKITSATVEKTTATLQTAVPSQLTPQQSQAVGPVEDDASLILFKEDEHQTTTVIAHNGEDGQIIRGRGALSFRLGDFFRGKDIEQMRLTPEGNLGIGITNPQAKLDVDGLIRASQGIVFPDGSIQFSAARRTFGARSLRPGQPLQAQGKAGLLEPDASGTGTTGAIPKWSDGPGGVLSDSNITEVSGAIGINGAPSTSFRLDVNGSTRIRGSNPGFNLEGLRAGGNIWLFQTVDDNGRFRLFGQDNVSPGVERLTISLSTGNVGIGATNPLSRLDVAGDINTSTQYSIGGSRILSTAGIENAFVGVIAGYSITTGQQNAFVGSYAGANNDSGGRNSFFGSHAGDSNANGVRNTAIGYSANVGFNNLTNGTAIGSQARVDQSNSLVLGSIAGVNGAFENTKVGIGVTAPLSTLHVVSFSNSGVDNTATFSAAGIGGNQSHIHYGTNGDWYIRSAVGAGKVILQDSGGNVGIGTGSPGAKLHVVGGDVAITSFGNGLILKAYSDIVNLCYRLAVDIFGTLSTSQVPCP